MLKETIKRRTKQCEGCGNDFVVSNKKALSKARFCSQKCFMKSIPREKRVEMAKKAATHGMYKTRIYRIWGAMKSRCTCPTNAAYHRYGGIGITLDPKWLSFEGFYEDMGDTYKDDLTIDRIDGTKGYSKENCRWATRREQSANIRTNVFVDCEGERLCASACARKLRCSPSTIYWRIRTGVIKQI